MATSIGTVYMNLRATSTNLRGDIKKSIGFTKKEFARAAKDIAKVATGAIAGAAAAMTAATVQGLKAVDNLAKTSDKLGATTEALQGLRHSAELTGVAANTLDMGIQRMTRRISEAAQGTGEAKAALKELGLSAIELNQLPIDQQFSSIADAMGRVQNQSDKIRLSMRLFDSEGVALVNTLKLGSEGLEAARQELDEFGVSINRIDAAKVERANDAFKRVGSLLSGVGQRMAVEFAPAIEYVANKLIETTKAANLLALESSSGMSDAILVAVGFGQNVANVIQQIWDTAKAATSWIILGLSKIFIVGEKVFLGLKAVGGLVFTGLGYSVIRFVETSISAIKKLNKSLVGVADVLPGINGDALKKSIDNAFAGVDGSLAESRNKAEKQMAGFWNDLTRVSSQEASQYLQNLENVAKAHLDIDLEQLRSNIENRVYGEDVIAQIIAGREMINSELEALKNDLSKPFDPQEIKIPISMSLDSSLDELSNSPSQALAAFRLEYDRLVQELNKKQIGIEEFQKAVGKMKDRVREAGQVFASTRTDAENYQAEIADLNHMLEQGVITQDTYNRAIEQTARKYDLSQRPIKAVQRITEKYRQTIAKLRDDLKTGRISVDQFNIQSEEAAKKFQESQRDIQKHIALIGDAWDTVGYNVGSAIDQLVDHGKFSFKNLVNSILSDMTKLALRRVVMGAMSNAFSGVMGMFGFGGAFADGGRPPKGVPSLVGEEGPELWVPDQSGTILSHAKTKSLLSGLRSNIQSPAVSGAAMNQPSQGSAAAKNEIINNSVTNDVNNKEVNANIYQTNHFGDGVTYSGVAEIVREHGDKLIDQIIDNLHRGGAFRKAMHG